MRQLGGFTETEELVSTGHYRLSNVQENDSRKNYILKRFHQLDDHGLVVLRNGVKLAQELKLDLILEPTQFYEEGTEAAILYKPFDGISLRAFLKQEKRVSGTDFIKVAKNITGLLSGFHSRGWIIRNFCTEHILIDPDSYQCKLADLQKASRINKSETIKSLEDTDIRELYYISPEQTGRINQISDHRTDLYSLGIVLYELLTGSLPFTSSDPIEIIHAHLAVTVKPPRSIDSRIPKILNDIVLKLVAKDLEERYQSCQGLLEDLDLALSHLDSDETYILGQKDAIYKIIPTSKLIGRQEELEQIHSCYELVKSGQKQLLYISGHSGVGKTRLVNEFYKDILLDNAFIVEAKFDILQKNTPYSALLNAVRSLVSNLLRKEDELIEYWRDRILSALKENASLISAVVPELEALIGSPAPVESLPPEESQLRFQQTFINFIVAFTSEQNTLILFLDDLQWADIASLRLLEMLVLDEQVSNLLFIGAYRDNEVDKSHPLSISILKLEEHIGVTSIGLGNLSKSDTQELLFKTLHAPILEGNAFADLVYKKTAGNTFYSLQFLTSLFEEKILFQNEKGKWEWDTELVKTKSVSENVIDLMVNKFKLLDLKLQTILKIAACIGDEFDLKILAQLTGDKLNQLAEVLSEIINLGYLISIDENFDAYFKLVSTISDQEIQSYKNARFKFAHDRIRQAALFLVDDSELVRLNLEAARIKINQIPDAQKEEDIFYLANHLNIGEPMIQDKNEINQLIHYNYQAGIKAKNASAFDSSIAYFDQAKKHLNFEENYQMLYDIQLQQSECKYLTGAYDEAEKQLDQLFENCNTRLDKLNTLFIKVYLYNLQDKKNEAMDMGRKGYSLYNIKMPSKDATIMSLLMKDLVVARLKVPENKIKGLLDRPQMQDEERKRFQEFLLAMSPTIYQYNQKLFAWNVMRMFFASLKHGNNGVSSICYIGYGMLVSQLFGKYTQGEKLAEVAIQLNNQLDYAALKWKVRLSYFNFVHHWTQPIRPSLEKILEVENGAFANGDPIFAGYAIFIYHQKKYALGYRLDILQESFETYLKQVDKRNDLETRRFLQSYYYATRCLNGSSIAPEVMGDTYNAPQRIKDSIDQLNYSVTADISIAYMGILYLFGFHEMAWQQYMEASQWVSFVEQRYEFAEYNFYGLLICAAEKERDVSKSRKLSKLAKKHLKKLKVWSALCPENFDPQYRIALAVFESIFRKNANINSLYEQAIASAQKYKFINYKALASELAGMHNQKVGNPILAQTFLNKSRHDYKQWGAFAKVEQIENEFSELLGESILESTTDVQRNALVAGMDLNLVMQANQAIKSMKDIDRLIGQLMDVIIKYSGADTGYLLINSKSELMVTGKYSVEKGFEPRSEYADDTTLPLSIIRYVTRLKKMQILNNPAQDAEYSRNPYFKDHHPKSLICYPILKQAEVFGILFLENQKHSGVFNKEKLGILNLISAQIAVSLDNAFLYENMEQKVLERTKKIRDEKGKVDEMLENILPKASIDELKRTGKTTAQRFDGVTVLLADIKGFTKIAEKLSPDELIRRIDLYFRTFDEIMTKYNLDKIKTIGDAYMAAGGLKGKSKENAVNMVHAAMDMQKFVAEQNVDVPEDHKLEIRIGINTGPVIAGVVGTIKYQYDIWGDTVNIAARMEAQSDPGRINVSLATFELCNDAFKFMYRGKIKGKNKGLMDMYFVESKIGQSNTQSTGA